MNQSNIITYTIKLFNSFEDAQKVLDDMNRIISGYGILTIEDINDLMDRSSVMSDIYYGWTDISAASVKRIPIGYYIDLPAPTCLYDKKIFINSMYGVNPRWDIVFPQIFHDVKHLDTDDTYTKTCAFPANIYECIQQSIDDSTEVKEDLVNHPNHYQSESGLEVIDVIDAFTDGLDGVEAFDTGNIIKYICRWKKKNGLQDLEKAKWYLENLIKEVKEKENEDAK